MVLHDLIVGSSVSFLVVLGHAACTGLRFPLEQVLASSAEHVFLGDGRRKLVKHLPNPRPIGTFAGSLWDSSDCDRCAVARVERASSETKLHHNPPVSSRCGCSTCATSGGTTSDGRNHCVRRNHSTSTTAGAITNSFDFAHDCLPSVARVLVVLVLLCSQRTLVFVWSNNKNYRFVSSKKKILQKTSQINVWRKTIIVAKRAFNPEASPAKLTASPTDWRRWSYRIEASAIIHFTLLHGDGGLYVCAIFGWMVTRNHGNGDVCTVFACMGMG